MTPPLRAIVVMGVTGSGKSTLGNALAQALGWRFVEGDTLHPAANIQKMAAGLPLDDADRVPFLENIAQVLAQCRPEGIVVSCSALARRYRDRIRTGEPGALFVLPVLTREQLERRLQGRTGHFMPASLLDSQLATLEPLQSDELSIQVPGNESVAVQIRNTIAGMRTLGPAAGRVPSGA